MRSRVRARAGSRSREVVGHLRERWRGQPRYHCRDGHLDVVVVGNLHVVPHSTDDARGEGAHFEPERLLQLVEDPRKLLVHLPAAVLDAHAADGRDKLEIAHGHRGGVARERPRAAHPKARGDRRVKQNGHCILVRFVIDFHDESSLVRAVGSIVFVTRRVGAGRICRRGVVGLGGVARGSVCHRVQAQLLAVLCAQFHNAALDAHQFGIFLVKHVQIARDLNGRRGRERGEVHGGGRSKTNDHLFTDGHLHAHAKKGVHPLDFQLRHQLSVHIVLEKRDGLTHGGGVGLALRLALRTAHARLQETPLPNNLELRRKLCRRKDDFGDVFSAANRT
eukprot:Opistho-2@5276